MGLMFDPKRFLQKARSYWPLWVGVALLAFGAGNLAGLMMPEKYRATALLQVHPPRPELTPRTQARSLDPRDQVQVVPQTMRSMPFLRNVAVRLNLAPGLDPGSADYHGLVQGISSRLEIYTGQNDLIRLRYVDYDPQRAAMILQGIIDEWRDRTDSRIRVRTGVSVDFLRERFEESQRRLEEAQNQVLAYQENHKDILDSDHQRQRDEMVRSRRIHEQQIQGWRQGIALAEARLEREPRLIETSRTIPSSDPQLLRMRLELNQMERRMELMLEDYSTSYPGVVELRRAIGMQRDIIEQAEKGVQVHRETEEQPNPNYLALSDQIRHLELQIAQSESSIREINQTIRQIDESLEKVPAHQMRLANLKLIENSRRTDMQELQRQLINAQLEADIERQGHGATYDLIELPEAPMRPISPNRNKIAALSFFAALGAAASLVWLLALIDSSVRTMDEARAVLQMPVLGVVQRIQTVAEQARHRRRRRRLIGLGATTSVLAVAALVMVLYGNQVRTGMDLVRGLIDR